ncbi:MAG: hypothetical protein PARBA_03971 [Parabacteroides sp.]
MFFVIHIGILLLSRKLNSAISEIFAILNPLPEIQTA